MHEQILIPPEWETFYRRPPLVPPPVPFLYTILKPPRRTYGEGREAKVMKEELDGFEFSMSRAWKAITEHFGTNLRLREMKAMVSALVFHIKETTGELLPMPSRNAKRSVALLVKYIDTHYDRLVPYFSQVEFCDERKAPIPFLDASRAAEDVPDSAPPERIAE
jgi:hypothetical protein